MADFAIDKIAPPKGPAAGTPNTGKDSGFADMVKAAVSRTNRADLAAERSVADLLEGRATIVDTMLALQKADVSMRLTLAVRNKVLDAYRTIMHMQF